MIIETDGKVKYVAEISPVREVWLVGAADLGFWSERLKSARLVPSEFDGRARILVSAIEARYLGVRFRELCISVFVRDERGGAGRDQAYLAQGFHSSRVFAWFERTLFSTPYVYGKIGVNASVPASIRFVAGGQPIFLAEMSPDRAAAAQGLIRSGEECWDGSIYLPANERDSGPGKVFFAKMTGTMRTYAFGADDLLVVQRMARRPALGWLIDSSFTGQQWSVRENGTHARSKTFRRE
jgi:hypothetical protein